MQKKVHQMFPDWGTEYASIFNLIDGFEGLG